VPVYRLPEGEMYPGAAPIYYEEEDQSPLPTFDEVRAHLLTEEEYAQVVAASEEAATKATEEILKRRTPQRRGLFAGVFA